MKKAILDIAKLIGAVATIAGAALWFDARFDAQAERDKELLEMVDYNSIHLSQIDVSIQGIQDTLDELDKGQKIQEDRMNSLVWGLKNIERFTPEDFEDVLDEMIRRKEVVTPIPHYSGAVEFEPID